MSEQLREVVDRLRTDLRVDPWVRHELTSAISSTSPAPATGTGNALDPEDRNVLIESLQRWCQGYVEPFPDLSVAQAHRIIARLSAPSEAPSLAARIAADMKAGTARFRPPTDEERAAVRKFKLGDLVYKKGGSQWHGKVVGFYATELTPSGVCVESIREKGSVQIYPEEALNNDEA